MILYKLCLNNKMLNNWRIYEKKVIISRNKKNRSRNII